MLRSNIGYGCLALTLIGGALSDAVSTPAAAQDASAQPAKPKPAKAKAAAKAAPAAEAGGAAGDTGAPRDAAAAQRSFDAGVAAYQAGRHDEAINNLNTAVRAGGLSGATLARALYFRGAAFHAKAMPGQAISDLTSALWFKGGLNTEERAAATRIRSEAYQSAGLSDQGGVSSGQAAVATGGSTSASTGWAAASVPAAGSSGTGAASPQLSAVPVEGAASGGGTSLGLPDIGGMLGGLFGGSSSSKPVETAAIAPAAPVAMPAATVQPSSSSTSTEVLPWQTRGAAETVAPSPEAPAAKQPAKVAAPKPAKPARAAGAAGVYRIQVATVKSQDEANAIAAKAKGSVAGAAVNIDQMTFGGSSFYRVRLGPFADAAETEAPCSALKASGLDCLVVTQ
jgi:cell division septation protein DedD